MKKNFAFSMLHPSRFVDRFSFLYRLRLRLRVYLANQRVRSTFGKRNLAIPLPLLPVAGLLLIGLGWFFFTTHQPRERLPHAGGTVSFTHPLLKTGKESPVTTGQGTPKSHLKGRQKRLFKQTRVDLVNVRTGPFLESDIVARLNAGYVLEVLKRRGDWILADAGDGLTGWIYTKLLREASARDYKTWRAGTHDRGTAKKISRIDSEGTRSPQEGQRRIKAILNQWKEAWEAKDIDRYMDLYSKDFFTPRHDWKSYRAYKEYLFKKASFISVTLAGIQVRQADNRFIARFIQTYQSDSVRSTTQKVMYFRREKGKWKILEEAVIKNPR